jgi:hypothetical protein
MQNKLFSKEIYKVNWCSKEHTHKMIDQRLCERVKLIKDFVNDLTRVHVTKKHLLFCHLVGLKTTCLLKIVLKIVRI